MSRDRVLESCRAYVSTMRGFLDEAERRLDDETRSPEDLVRACIHALTWGSANAGQNLETATAWLERERIRASVGGGP